MCKKAKILELIKSIYGYYDHSEYFYRDFVRGYKKSLDMLIELIEKQEMCDEEKAK